MDEMENFIERANGAMNGPPRPLHPSDDGWTLVSPVPADAPKLDVVLKIDGEWRQPDFVWRYTNTESHLLGYTCRWNTADLNDKRYSFATFWRHNGGEMQWRLKHLPAPRPLLNLHGLLTKRPNDPVLVVEGEKAAGAAHGLFKDMVVTTSIGGANNASHADWSPLAGRDVTIWPDADDAGARYAQDVARLAHDSGARSIAIVNVSAMPPHWDLADPVPSNADIHVMLADALPWRPEANAERAKNAAISNYGTAGPEFVRELIAKEVTGKDVQAHVTNFVAETVPAGSDGQIERAAQRFGLIATAGELATALGVTPWRRGEAREAATWALGRWIEERGGTGSAEAQQAIAQVRQFIEQHGASRFEAVDGGDERPVNNRAGWRKGSGREAEWLIPPETWKVEICKGLDAKMVARTLFDRGMLRRASDGFQQVRKIGGANKRVYVLTAEILAGGGDEG